MSISPQIAVEGALNMFISALLPDAEVHTGSAPQDSSYPIVHIEHIVTRSEKAFKNQHKVRCLSLQIRCVATEREDAEEISHAIDEALLGAASFPLSGGWSCVHIRFENALPTFSLPDTAGVVYTQTGNEYTFDVQ